MALTSNVWATSDDGQIEFKSLTKQYLDGALKVMEEGFLPYEKTCTAMGLMQDRESVLEVLELCKIVALDGICLVAVQKSSDQVVGAAFNKLKVKSNEKQSDLETFVKTSKRKCFQRLILFMEEADESANLFELLNVDCLMEVLFAGVLPSFTRRGFAKRLIELSTEMGKQLSLGNNVRQSLDGSVLTLESRPKAMDSLFTSPFTRKIGRSLNWTIASKIDYKNFFYNGKSFAELLNDNDAHATVEYFKLNS